MTSHSKVSKARNIYTEVTGNQFNDKGEQLLTIKLDKQIPKYMIERYLDENGVLSGEFTLFDNRIITAAQRKKIFAILRDIVNDSGNGKDPYDVESMKEDMKVIFCEKEEIEMFSLSEHSKTCTVSLASRFITYLLDFCMEYNVGITVEPLSMVEDIKHYLIKCLHERYCAICWEKGEVHHVDTVGAGRDRKHIDHTKHELMCLCRKHHDESHFIGQETFAKKYHVLGVVMNEEQFKKMKYRG